MNWPAPLSRVLLCFVLALLSALAAPAIDFDNTFGSNGKFTTSFASSGQPSSSGSEIFLQPIGRFLIVGRHQQDTPSGRRTGIALAGLTIPGALDNGFGTGGKALVWSDDVHRFLTNAVVGTDGAVTILFQFWQSTSNNRPAAIRLSQNGQIDQSFSPDLDVVPNQTAPVLVAPASDGKIYVLVRTFQYQFFMIRLNPDGSRDTAYGMNGVRELNLNRFSQPTITGLREADNGRLLITGHTYGVNFADGPTFLLRLNSDGTFDRSFGVQGVVRITFPGGSVQAVVTEIQPDGKILIGGYWTFLGSNAFIARLTPRGRPDSAFGTNGITMTSFNNINGIQGIAVAPDGKIVVAGSTGAKAIPSNQRLFVARFSSTGVRESHLVTNFLGDREAGASDIFLQPDGRMVIAAYTQNLSDNNTQLAAARFVP